MKSQVWTEGRAVKMELAHDNRGDRTSVYVFDTIDVAEELGHALLNAAKEARE